MKKACLTIKRTYLKYPLVCQIILGLLIMSPILLASCYTHPWWDDYIYTTPGHLQFEQDHSLLGVVKNAVDISYYKYVNNSGVFAHHFIAAMFPLFIGYHWYKVGMLLCNLFFVFSVYFLAVTLGDRALGLPRTVSSLAGTLILTITSYFMPTPHEFFFWMSGACNYTLIVSFLSCAVALFIRACKRPTGIVRLIEVFLTSLAVFAIGGCNQSTALFMYVLVVISTVVVWILKYSRFARYAVLFVLLFATVGFALNVFSSGNQDRLSSSEQMMPLAAIWESLTNMLYKVFEWSGVSLVAGAAVFPLFMKASAKLKFRFSHPFLFLVFSFCVMATQLTPPLYAIQSTGPGRVMDCVYYSYLWWFFGNLFYISGWIVRRLRPEDVTKRLPRFYPAIVLVLAMVVLSPAAIKDSNGVVCISQFLNGEIQTYNKEMNAIHQALETSELDSVTVPDLTADPIIRAGSFSEDPNNIINQTAAEYHGKKELIVIKQGKN